MTTVLAERERPTAHRVRHAPALTAIAPIVPVQNVAVSLRFYVNRLGFETLQRNPNGSAALIARGSVRLMLIRVPHQRALEATREHLSAYIWTTDVEALYRQLAPMLDGLPAHRVRPPFRQPYGTLEFHVKDPDGFLLFFAEDPSQHVAPDDNDPSDTATYAH
ncbi:MAG: VOC family protein [Pseudomonadota bacterium]